MYLGIEIGGTKLQLALGRGDGRFVGFWRGTIDPQHGAAGIQRQILEAYPELLATAGVDREAVRAAGIGFGGPVDDATRSVITSHQVGGWDQFPLADWLTHHLQIPARLGNDADAAALAEATLGAGRGCDPVFYMTVGSGIGGGLVLGGALQRGTGRGAAEIGHLRLRDDRPGGDGEYHPLEHLASGWGIAAHARRRLQSLPPGQRAHWPADVARVTTHDVAAAARAGDPLASEVLRESIRLLAEAVRSVIVLLCPRRFVIGGGVSLLGEEWFFAPLRRALAGIAFAPFDGLTEVVPAELGEEVVIHGAIALAQNSRIA